MADIEQAFRREFGPLANKFVIDRITLDQAEACERRSVDRAGVYVFWKAEWGVIKVGKHLVNARTRALQHVEDNTRNDRLEMKTLRGDPSCYLLIFGIRNNDDAHWIASLECYLEKLDPRPVIPSRRSG
jgi:hypothetical protein